MRSGFDAFSRWRKEEQLVGLQNRHDAYRCYAFPLAAAREAGVRPAVATGMAVHSSEDFVAASFCTPFFGGEIHTAALSRTPSAWSFSPVSQGFATLPPSEAGAFPGPVYAMEWVDELLFVASNKCEIHVCGLTTAQSSARSARSQVLEVKGTLGFTAQPRFVQKESVSASEEPATTVVRKIKLKRHDEVRWLGGLSGSKCGVWDLQANRRTPTQSASFGGSPLLSALEWCPSSDTLLCVGSSSGNVGIFDLRLSSVTQKPSVSFPAHGSFVSALSFNSCLPTVLSTCAISGIACVFDVRSASTPILSWNSVQQGVTCSEWMPHHADMMVTGGADGTVKMWNLRCEPSNCIGSADFDIIVDLHVTQTLHRERVIALTATGAVCCVEPTVQLLHAIAPHTVSRAGVLPPPADDSILQAERKAEQHLYARDVAAGLASLLQCVTELVQRNESVRAIELLSMMERAKPAELEPDFLQCNEVALGELLRDVGRIPVHIGTASCLRGADPVAPQVLRQLESLQLNATLGAIIQSNDIDKLVAKLGAIQELVRSAGAQASTADAALFVSTADLLLRERPLIGMTFVEGVVNDCLKAGAMPLVRVLVSRVIAPTIADPPPPNSSSSEVEKKCKRVREEFYRSEKLIRASVGLLFELTRISLAGAADTPRSIISAVLRYEKEHPVGGIISIVSLAPIMMYLAALLAAGSYVGFFCTGAQWLERYKGLPNVAAVETLLLQELGRIQRALKKSSTSLAALARAGSTHASAVASAASSLAKFHHLVSRVSRTMLECESIARQTDRIPQVIGKVVDTMGASIAESLEAWQRLLDLMKPAASKQVRDAVAEFQKESTYLMVNVSTRGQQDETLSAVVEVCSEFLARNK